MTLAEFERRLKQANPRLYVKRYGSSKAGIHVSGSYGRQAYVCRVPQGEINPYNEFKFKWGQASQFVTNFNPKGYYKYKLMHKRGRLETARILYTQRLIKYSDISKLSI